MTEKEILNNILFALTSKKNFFKKSVGAEINTKESLTSQEHYTVQDLVNAFIREKPELVATAREIDDDDAPDFPKVDAHDDIIDIEEKLEDAQRVSKSDIQVDSKEQLQQSFEKTENSKVENVDSVSKISSTDAE